MMRKVASRGRLLFRWRLGFFDGAAAYVIVTRTLVLGKDGRQPASWYAAPVNQLAEAGSAGEVPEMKRLASIYIDIPAMRPGTVGAYALALLSAAVALALRVAIDPYVVGVQYVTFFPVVIITALISGFRAGLLCVILSAAAADFFVLPPRWSFYIEHPGEVLALLLFILATLSTVILIAGMRFAIEGYRELSRNLEHRVEERGEELAEVQQRLELEATFRAMFNISSVGKFEVDPASTRFLRVNAAMCKLVGTPRRNCWPGPCLTLRIPTTATTAASWLDALTPESQTFSMWKSAISAKMERSLGADKSERYP